MKIKRIVAYLIDYIIIAFIVNLIFTAPIFENYYNKYEETTKEYVEFFFNDTSGSSDISEEDLINYLYNIEFYGKPQLFMQLGISLLYFGVLAYLLKGQTLGKKVMKIKVVPITGQNLNVSRFMLRSVLVSNAIPELLSALAILFCTRENWYIYQNIISYIQYGLYFLMIGFMIYRDDERGLHDLIGGTKVVEA